MLHLELEEIIRSCASAGNMACSWRVHDEFTSSDNRLRISLMTPVEEPWIDFLDLRRMFEKNSEVLPTKRGMRIPITTHQLLDLVDILRDIGQGRKSHCETAGLRLIRQTNVLHIRKVPRAEDEGGHPMLLVLTPSEVIFLMEKMPLLRDIMLARQAEDEEEVLVINEEEENLAWF